MHFLAASRQPLRVPGQIISAGFDLEFQNVVLQLTNGLDHLKRVAIRGISTGKARETAVNHRQERRNDEHDNGKAAKQFLTDTERCKHQGPDGWSG